MQMGTCDMAAALGRMRSAVVARLVSSVAYNVGGFVTVVLIEVCCDVYQGGDGRKKSSQVILLPIRLYFSGQLLSCVVQQQRVQVQLHAPCQLSYVLLLITCINCSTAGLLHFVTP
jgi:hypothetical protein